MKAFLSYSINDSDQFVIPLLAKKLQTQGFFVTNGGIHYSENLEYQTINEINSSNLFIGILTYYGKSNNRVYQEWHHSLINKIPSILLIEDTILIYKNIENYPNVIKFNRHQPQSALNKIKFKIDKAKNTENNQLEEAVPWIIGGIAVIALIGLLSKK